MATKLTINMTTNLAEYMQLNRYRDKNRSVLMKTAANRYLQYLRNRYITNSSGGGDWDELEDSTVQRKIRRGIAPNPEAIMRESDEVLDSLSMRTRGQQVFVGYPRETGHYRSPGVNFLVKIHATGGVFLPIRTIVVDPPKHVEKKMVDDIKNEYNKIIRRNRRK